MQTEDANNENRTTLIGIVSGGIGCGLGIPAWYTRVSFHFKWIRCVVYYSALYNNNQKKVVEACKNTVQSEPTCVQETDLVFGRQELKQLKIGKSSEFCENPTNNYDDGRNY